MLVCRYEEKGIAIGEAKEKAKIIISMYKNGFTAEQMAAATDNDIEDIAAIIKGMANSKKLSQWLHNPYTGEEIEITATTENALNNKCEKQIKAWEKEQAEWGGSSM